MSATPPATDWGVARALAPGEARRIVRSVAFLAFLPLSILTLSSATQDLTPWELASIDAALGLVPLAWCLLVLTDLAVLRDKRHGVAAWTDTMPASPTGRTGGHLLGGLVGVPVGAVLLAVWILVAEEGHFLADGTRTGSLDLLELAVPLLLVAGGAVVGVALARWIPTALVTIPAILVTILITGKIGEARILRTRFLGFVADGTSTSLPALEVRPAALHLLWLVAWIGIMAVVALLRYDRSAAVWGAGGVLVVTAALTGYGQLRPVDDRTAAERADLLNRPRRHQTCTTVDRVTYCAFPATDENRSSWPRTVRAVTSHLPAAVGGRELTVAQRVPWTSANPNCGPTITLGLIDQPIIDRVSVDQAWASDGQVHPGIVDERLPCGGDDLENLYTAVQTGAWSVGLPPAEWGRGRTCAADGQARAAVALWLGAAGGGDLGSFLGASDFGPDGRFGNEDWDDRPTWGVDYHPTDVEAALVMAHEPAAEVDQVLAHHWDEIVDPDTPTAQLYEWLDLPGHAASIRAPLDTCPAP